MASKSTVTCKATNHTISMFSWGRKKAYPLRSFSNCQCSPYCSILAPVCTILYIQSRTLKPGRGRGSSTGLISVWEPVSEVFWNAFRRIILLWTFNCNDISMNHAALCPGAVCWRRSCGWSPRTRFGGHVMTIKPQWIVYSIVYYGNCWFIWLLPGIQPCTTILEYCWFSFQCTLENEIAPWALAPNFEGY